MAADFFTVEVWTRRGLQRFLVLFFIELSTRRVQIAGIAIREFVAHYHLERNHQGLGNRLITPAACPMPGRGPIRRRKRLGGMLNYYHRAA